MDTIGQNELAQTQAPSEGLAQNEPTQKDDDVHNEVVQIETEQH
jgi:hypothetical protein